MQEINKLIQAKASELVDEVLSIRRYLHQHPELSFQEFETSKFIQQRLDQWGIPFTNNWVKTGIVVLLKGKSEGKAIALRADIDALPLQEVDGRIYGSKNKGIMHACGHDVHTASMLGTVKILHELKDYWHGEIKVIFQPGEELLPGGASKMIEEGVLESPIPENIIGQHVYPDLEVGKVGFRLGMYMASCNELYFKVRGKGGHAALPHKLIDPVVMMANLITALQQINSRNLKAGTPSVLSIGKIEANGATNIIPNEVLLQGTFRTMDEDWRNHVHKRIHEIANGVADSFGGVIEVEIKKGYPFLKNDESVTKRAKEIAEDLLGKENVIDLDLRMTAEDFAYYSQVVPACFYRLGTRNESRGIAAGLHTSEFDVDEGALEIGMSLMAAIAINETAE